MSDHHMHMHGTRHQIDTHQGNHIMCIGIFQIYFLFSNIYYNDRRKGEKKGEKREEKRRKKKKERKERPKKKNTSICKIALSAELIQNKIPPPSCQPAGENEGFHGVKPRRS